MTVRKSPRSKIVLSVRLRSFHPSWGWRWIRYDLLECGHRVNCGISDERRVTRRACRECRRGG